MINEYLSYLQEGYIFNDKTISIDLDRFESKESNKLIISGLSGAGKSTLGNHLANKYNCHYEESDECCGQTLTDEENQIFFNPDTSLKERDKLVKKVMPKFWKSCFKPMLLSNKRMIIEGPLYQAYNQLPEARKLMNQYPSIILGTSAVKAVYGRMVRANKKRKRTIPENLKKLKLSIWINFAILQKELNNFRNERVKAGGDIQTFEVPRL